MGLGVVDLIDDNNGSERKLAATVKCSVCLDVVTDNGDRSWAKLLCGHTFHLDCIGSAFNAKGAMQCPNCRKIEKGQWLYAHGSEFNMYDWPHGDLYDFSQAEMFGVHWCPYSGVTRFPASYDDGEFQSSPYNDRFGHQPVFAEHTTPHFAYIGPIYSSSSTSSESVSDGSNYSNWGGPSVPSEVPNSYAFPSMDAHYHNWDHSPPFAPSNRANPIDRVNQRAGMHPFVIGHSSASRAPGSSIASPYPVTVTRSRERPSVQAPVPSAISSGRRSRGSTQVAPMPTASDQSNGFYFLSTSSSRAFHEVENPYGDAFHEHQSSFLLSQVDGESIWGLPFHPPARSDPGFRSYGHRRGP